MLSVSLLNAVLNACLWFAHAMIALVAQRVYVAAARLQLAKSGETHGTDSNETNFLHWLQKKIGEAMRSSSGNQRTAGWAIIIMLVMFALLPAELVLESGLEVRQDCYVALNHSQTGVCADPFRGASLLHAGAMALLVSKFPWLDNEWQFVREGSSVMLWSNEVRSVIRSPAMADPQQKIKYLAKNCVVTNSACTDCGSLNIIHQENIASYTVNQSSYLLKGNSTRYCLGDLVGVKKVKTGFVFCQDSLQTPISSTGKDTIRFSSVGIESIIENARQESSTGGHYEEVVNLQGPKTRVYNVACDTDGLASKDLTTALAMMRAALIQTYPLIEELNGTLASLPALTASDALKAVFALKASDRLSNCTADVEVYQECGSFQWRQASYVCFLYALMLITWFIMSLISAKYSDIAVPHDSVTWRKYAYEGLILFHDHYDDDDETRTSDDKDSDPMALAPASGVLQSPGCDCHGLGGCSKSFSPGNADESKNGCDASQDQKTFGAVAKKLTFSPAPLEIPLDDDDVITPVPDPGIRSAGRVSVISADQKGGFVARRLSIIRLPARRAPTSARSPSSATPTSATKRARARCDRAIAASGRREGAAMPIGDGEATCEEMEEERTVTTQKNVLMCKTDPAKQKAESVEFTPNSDGIPGADSPGYYTVPMRTTPFGSLRTPSAIAALNASIGSEKTSTAAGADAGADAGAAAAAAVATDPATEYVAPSPTPTSSADTNNTDKSEKATRGVKLASARRKTKIGPVMTPSGAVQLISPRNDGVAGCDEGDGTSGGSCSTTATTATTDTGTGVGRASGRKKARVPWGSVVPSPMANVGARSPVAAAIAANATGEDATSGGRSAPNRLMSVRSPKSPWGGLGIRRGESVENEVRSASSQTEMRYHRQRTVRLDCRNGEVSSKVLLVRGPSLEGDEK